MKKHAATIVMLILAAITASGQGNKPLKVTSLTLHFGLNLVGDNASLAFMGKGFAGGTSGGTTDSWTYSGQIMLPGETLEPLTGVLFGACCGQLEIGGIIYLWPDPNVGASYVILDVAGIAGDAFTFPDGISPTSTWVVQVPAKLYPYNNAKNISIRYWTDRDPQGTTSRMSIREGKLTLTWFYNPPSEYFPSGWYSFAEGVFNAQSRNLQ
jgi:hypothetical protein